MNWRHRLHLGDSHHGDSHHGDSQRGDDSHDADASRQGDAWHGGSERQVAAGLAVVGERAWWRATPAPAPPEDIAGAQRPRGALTEVDADGRVVGVLLVVDRLPDPQNLAWHGAWDDAGQLHLVFESVAYGDLWRVALGGGDPDECVAIGEMAQSGRCGFVTVAAAGLPRPERAGTEEVAVVFDNRFRADPTTWLADDADARERALLAELEGLDDGPRCCPVHGRHDDCAEPQVPRASA